MPDRWLRKFNAVRSPVRIGASGPLTEPITQPASTVAPSRCAQFTSSAGSICANDSSAQPVPAMRPGSRATNRAVAPRLGIQQRRGQVTERRQVLGKRTRHGVAHRRGGWFHESHNR